MAGPPSRNAAAFGCSTSSNAVKAGASQARATSAEFRLTHALKEIDKQPLAVSTTLG